MTRVLRRVPRNRYGVLVCFAQLLSVFFFFICKRTLSFYPYKWLLCSFHSGVLNRKVRNSEIIASPFEAHLPHHHIGSLV